MTGGPKLDANGRLIVCDNLVGKPISPRRVRCPECGGTFRALGGRTLPIHSPGEVEV